MTAIVAQGLGKRFGRTVGLSEIDLDIRSGACLAVFGPNGAGKSTLLRLVAGLAKPSAGSLELDGQPAHGRIARAAVGFIGHASHLYPELTARENLVFASRLYGVDDPAERATSLLDEEDLTRVADRPVRVFSRGMVQRLAIARGLVHDPSVVLFDEPFTGLDRRSADRLNDRISQMHASGRTIVIVSHDLESASRLADSALVLARGEIKHHQVSTEGPLDTAALQRAYDQACEGGLA